MRLSLRVRTLDGLAANFFAADRRVRDGVRRVVDRSGHQQFALTAALCPFRTGFMLRTLRLTFSPDGLAYTVGWQAAAFTAAGFAFYPVFLEFGTRLMRARPSLYPARDLVRPAYRRDLRAVVRAGLRRRAAALGGTA